MKSFDHNPCQDKSKHPFFCRKVSHKLLQKRHAMLLFPAAILKKKVFHAIVSPIELFSRRSLQENDMLPGIPTAHIAYIPMLTLCRRSNTLRCRRCGETVNRSTLWRRPVMPGAEGATCTVLTGA